MLLQIQYHVSREQYLNDEIATLQTNLATQEKEVSQTASQFPKWHAPKAYRTPCHILVLVLEDTRRALPSEIIRVSSIEVWPSVERDQAPEVA